MMTRSSCSAFTLVELIMVIVIIGLLAAVVVPRFGDIKSEAQTSAETAAISAVQSGIKLARMTNLAKGSDTWPTTLDSATAGKASEANPLFGNVIEDGVTDPNWEKVNDTTYKYAPTGNQYAYDKTTGKLTKKSSSTASKPVAQPF
jgi:prepilin-type N-terminal cleavage/methylation domain-containing protein